MLVAFCVLASCDSPSTTTTSTTTNGETTIPEAALFPNPDDFEPCPTKAGDVITERMVIEGCADPSYEFVVRYVSWQPCEDGRRLWIEEWGNENLWGYIGEPLHEIDDLASAAPEYLAAYSECVP